MNFGPFTTRCPVCGKMIITMWQEFWTWRRGETFYCSENCLLVDLTRDTKAMTEVRKRRKGKFKMEKLKKDGTPAKKPGPKPKFTAKKIDIAPDPLPPVKITKIDPKVTQPAIYEDMVIREVEGLFGRYRYTDIGSAIYIDFENSDGLDTLSMTVEQWKNVREEQVKAAKILGVEL